MTKPKKTNDKINYEDDFEPENAEETDDLGLDEIEEEQRRQAELYLKLYNRFIDGFQFITKSWIDRRRKVTGNALRSVKSLSKTHNIEEMTDIYNQWVSESIKQVAEDSAALLFQAMVLGSSGLKKMQDEFFTETAKTATENVFRWQQQMRDKLEG